MANPLLQKARQRKMIYFGAIIALFTISAHSSRGHHQAASYVVAIARHGARPGRTDQLRGAPDAYRLARPGCYLALVHRDGQTKARRIPRAGVDRGLDHQATTYFITPWLYQSWNISFNVAVECDQPRDKYYYISRGLELLAEGNASTAARPARALSRTPFRETPS